MAQEDSIAKLQAQIKVFSEERDWDQFHTPKNSILAATSEMGELAEVLQWKSDDEAFASASAFAFASASCLAFSFSQNIWTYYCLVNSHSLFKI